MIMTDSRLQFPVIPGKSLGWITLGASLHAILTRLKAQPHAFTSIDLSYSSSEPVLQPVILNLPSNGVRLRFDGPDQRLRLIEVLDFSKSTLTYKNIDLVRRAKRSSEGVVEQETPIQGPPFRHVYNRLFGPSYPDEYVPPSAPGGTGIGNYVLSYPGVAFSFPLRDQLWSDKSDFVALLSSSAASPATSMAIFQGTSWPSARSTLLTNSPSLPRSLILASKEKDLIPDEIEEVRIFGASRVEMLRRSSSPVILTLSETTPQDLVAEFGPPDAIYRKHDNRISIHASSNISPGRLESTSSIARPRSADTDGSAGHSYSEDSDVDGALTEDGMLKAECFYNYFHHGFDALISFPTIRSPPFPGGEYYSPIDLPSSHLVVTKIIIHANVPGSFPFNRHRRLRWTIDDHHDELEPRLNSETPFKEISDRLRKVWQASYANPEEESSMQRGMVLNRGWGDSPESSIELLGGLEDSGPSRKASVDSMSGLNNTELFGFPGLLFEVLKNDSVSCLTVY